MIRNRTIYASKHAPDPDDVQMPWAQISQNKRVSYMHGPTSTPAPSNDMNGWTLRRSQVWRVGNSPSSVFIDVSTLPEPLLSVPQLAKDQFPENTGVIPHREGGRRVIIEIGFDEKNDASNRALTTGLQFDKPRVRILGTRAIPKNGLNKKLRLTHLPLLNLTTLLEGLKTSLQEFGHVLDVGAFHEPTTNLFMGNGYAVLNCQPDEETLGETFASLQHIIDWAGDFEHGFYATWADMPPYCTWCHGSDHGRQDCTKFLATQKKCWPFSRLWEPPAAGTADEAGQSSDGSPADHDQPKNDQDKAVKDQDQVGKDQNQVLTDQHKTTTTADETTTDSVTASNVSDGLNAAGNGPGKDDAGDTFMQDLQSLISAHLTASEITSNDGDSADSALDEDKDMAYYEHLPVDQTTMECLRKASIQKRVRVRMPCQAQTLLSTDLGQRMAACTKSYKTNRSTKGRPRTVTAKGAAALANGISIG
ncbi:hypothetical protein BDB00DRAFT_871472 [Zychaea mexicana]|uniref:uncharacterized protein n=1 Tax=Zychaea mexicana TaxID=64656 RepID=UPI0022FF057E|nr:uncharacterized protein BDB00DRAFT_871472 [Zychaea mexicana]KAI9494380.1 hypothetical protein BDB00DRAFT_871472 [Zychaea mexicana]